MKYYHGTPVSFDNFSMSEAKDYKDFGKGFYLAKTFKHASDNARKHNAGSAFVRVYDIDVEDMRKCLMVKEFKKPNRSWLDFVLLNRNSIVAPAYDIVIGPTVDSSNVQQKMEIFYRRMRVSSLGRKDYQEFIKSLAPYNFPAQMCCLTQTAVDYVERFFVEAIDIFEEVCYE